MLGCEKKLILGQVCSCLSTIGMIYLIIAAYSILFFWWTKNNNQIELEKCNNIYIIYSLDLGFSHEKTPKGGIYITLISIKN